MALSECTALMLARQTRTRNDRMPPRATPAPTLGYAAPSGITGAAWCLMLKNDRNTTASRSNGDNVFWGDGRGGELFDAAMISEAARTQVSQMYALRPDTSLATDSQSLPQKEHRVRVQRIITSRTRPHNE